jgi:hypothetical protein
MWNIKLLLPRHDVLWYKTVWTKFQSFSISYAIFFERSRLIITIFNSDIISVSVHSNVDRKYYQCIPKRGRRSDFKAEMYSWFVQRRGGTIASLFFCQKTVILYFENTIGPSQRTSRCRNWVTSPLAANISCCLTRGYFVVLS